MKTELITIATTNQDSNKKKFTKEAILKFRDQINKEPVPVNSGNTVVGLTGKAITKTSIHKNRIKLLVELDLSEEYLVKNVESFFIPICDDMVSDKKNDIELISDGKLIAICIVKEHYDKTISPTIFPYKIGVDFFVLEGSFVDKKVVDEIKLSGRPTYIYYSGDWKEDAMKRDAWGKGILQNKLDIPFKPFTVAHDTEPSFTEFRKEMEKVWISHNSQNLGCQPQKPTEKK